MAPGAGQAEVTARSTPSTAVQAHPPLPGFILLSLHSGVGAGVEGESERPS